MDNHCVLLVLCHRCNGSFCLIAQLCAARKSKRMNAEPVCGGTTGRMRMLFVPCHSLLEYT